MWLRTSVCEGVWESLGVARAASSSFLLNSSTSNQVHPSLCHSEDLTVVLFTNCSGFNKHFGVIVLLLYLVLWKSVSKEFSLWRFYYPSVLEKCINYSYYSLCSDTMIAFIIFSLEIQKNKILCKRTFSTNIWIKK